MTTIFEAAPYQNLILTGSMGVGKTTLGRRVAAQLNTEFFDLENEILAREGQSAGEIRETYGESRLKALEAGAIRDLTLRRHAVITISGPAVLDDENRARLQDSGLVLCLTCALNEILHRVYVARGAWFHNPANRGALLSRLKRELRVNTLDLPQLNVSALSVEDAADAVRAFWLERAQL